MMKDFILGQVLKRSYFQASCEVFRSRDEEAILGDLVSAHGFATDIMQRNAWQHQIQVLQKLLNSRLNGYILFEFAIPRMGKRADVIILLGGIVFVLEYKVGANSYDSSSVDQALDYAVDLKNFHEASHTQKIVPILVATGAPDEDHVDRWFEDGVCRVQKTNDAGLSHILEHFVTYHGAAEFDLEQWIGSTYKPTPTICEAAQALYAGHNVVDITRSDAGAINLSRTNASISRIIERSKKQKRKSICFITGVPGSGKTLAGLNLANERLNSHEDEHAVFLSGNGPLVAVLREALARDEVSRSKLDPLAGNVTKKYALTKASTFIQNIHHFRDENLRSEKSPVEQVVIFDEAQRAWTEHQASRFMREKRGLDAFSMSEPAFLLSVMDRHKDWCTVVCIIGGGQEINTGEAGISEWFKSLRQAHNHWDIYVSENLTGSDHFGGEHLKDHLSGLEVSNEADLHLSVSVRSFRSEKVSNFVHALIEGDCNSAQSHINHLRDYPLVLTRDVNTAKHWLRSKGRGSERTGLVASSNAQRLRAIGADIRVKIDPATWFLNDNLDVRSSYFLEDVATEFDIQGLELDWVGVCWDANLRRENNTWRPYQFKGTKWMNVKNVDKQKYLINSYRVLLTRARQGMVICVPEGDANDPTRLPALYDPIFSYLRSCGIPLILS